MRSRASIVKQRDRQRENPEEIKDKGFVFGGQTLKGKGDQSLIHSLFLFPCFV